MKFAPTPIDENQRLTELLNLQILDSSPESSFDDLTELASEICQTPIALISLIDSERQWFKSKVGLDATETPRNISYCGHAIMGEDIFEVPDATIDLRFKDNPLCVGAPHVRFYAGAPLITQSGVKLGTLCVISDQPKKLNEWQSKTLKKLARQVVLLIESRTRQQSVEEINSKLVKKIEETKLAESHLRKSNIDLDFILDGSGLGSWDLNLLTNQVTFDRRWCEMLGLDVDSIEHTYSTWEKLVHPDDLILAQTELTRHLGGLIDLYECTFRMKHTNGEWVWIVARAKICEFESSGKPMRLTGTHYNITAQKKNEESLRDNQEKVNAIYEGSYDSIMLLSADGFFDCNKKTLELFHVTSKEEFSKLRPENLSPKYQPDGSLSDIKAQKQIERAFELGAHSFEWIHSKTTGTEFPAEVLLAAFEFRGQKVLQAVVRDISERKKLEAFSLDVQRMAKVGGWEYDLVTNMVNWTDETYRIYGLDPLTDSDLQLEVAVSCYPQEARAKIEHLIYEAATFAKPWDEEVEFIDVNRIKKWVRTIGRPISNEEGKIVKLKGTFQDITERRILSIKFEEQRLISQHQAKLASIGQLAAGVGHEINNPLAVVNGYLSIIQDELQSGTLDNDHFLSMLRKMNNATERIANIVKGLRTFSRSDSNSLSLFNFKEALDETASLLSEIYQKEGIIFSFDSRTKEKLNIYGNKGRIEQAIVNLLSNARDATEGQEKRLVGLILEAIPGRAKLTITDNGKGIPDHIKDKIFDPFFTTKDVNKGTGIGLSILSSIIKEHNGEIYFSTEQNLGTSFTIEIPLCSSETTDHKETSNQTMIQAQSTKIRALVVDDEEGMREIMTLLLEKMGLEVTTAENGKIGLMKFYENHFDLVITDLRMPEMNGIELSRHVRSQKVLKVPKVIVMTGGINLSNAELATIDEVSDCQLSKPFSHHVLYEKIIEFLPKMKRNHKIKDE